MPTRISYFPQLAIVFCLAIGIAVAQDEPAQPPDVATESDPPTVTIEQRDQAVAQLKELGGKIRFFHDESHPKHWVQIQLRGNQFDDEQLESVKRIAERSKTNLHIRDTYVSAEGLKTLRGANIQSLSLRGVDIDDDCMMQLPHLPNLTTLQISHVDISDKSVAAIAKCPALESLRLSGERLTDAGLTPLKDLKTLRKLSLGLGFSAASLEPINMIPNLDGLHFEDGAPNEFLRKLKRLPQLTELELIGKSTDDETATILAEVAVNLKTVYLRRTGITDKGAVELAKLSNLETLTLSETPIHDESVAAFKELKNLRWLDLESSANITDDCLRHIGEMPQIKMLFLMDTAITAKGLEHLRSATDTLRHLDLQSTNVKVAPDWLKNQKKLYLSLDD